MRGGLDRARGPEALVMPACARHFGWRCCPSPETAMQSEQFPIHHVSRADAFRDETMGTKGKFWWRDGSGQHWLFKFGRKGTGEHWAEKAAAEVGALLQVPVAQVELAVCDGQPGTISLGFAHHATLVHGNELLQAIDSTYPIHEIRGVRAHTVQNVLSALDAVRAPAPDVALPSAADWFVGYLLLDAVILNTDRHHENWGVLERGAGLRELAPSYDHASSLGRELTDDERRRRVATRDVRSTVDRYVRRARSGLFLDPRRQGRCTPSTHSCTRSPCDLRPAPTGWPVFAKCGKMP